MNKKELKYFMIIGNGYDLCLIGNYSDVNFKEKIFELFEDNGINDNQLAKLIECIDDEINVSITEDEYHKIVQFLIDYQMEFEKLEKKKCKEKWIDEKPQRIINSLDVIDTELYKIRKELNEESDSIYKEKFNNMNEMINALKIIFSN